MTKARLLQAACATALLATAPAFAQTTTQPADTGAGNSVNAPVTHDSSAPSQAASPSNMAPVEKMGSTSGGSTSASSANQSTHRSATGGHTSGSMHARADTSQNAAVDQLNDQSYQAAHSGQAFSASGTAASGSGTMNDMSGGSPAGAASGSGGGAAGGAGSNGR